MLFSRRSKQAIKLRFYTTSGCHLCDQALDVISSSLKRIPYELEMIEIADSDALIEALGTKIPVLENPGISSQLCWPFGVKEVRKLVDASV